MCPAWRCNIVYGSECHEVAYVLYSSRSRGQPSGGAVVADSGWAELGWTTDDCWKKMLDVEVVCFGFLAIPSLGEMCVGEVKRFHEHCLSGPRGRLCLVGRTGVYGRKAAFSWNR
jgi:hypothetical protein